MHNESTSFAVMLRATFDGAPLTAIEYAGKPAWIASDVGRALGLSNYRHAAQRLREQKKEGLYWRDLSPEELEAVRNPCGLDARVTSGTLVLEPGLYWLAMTAETDRAETFREWLAEVHLPALRAERAAPIVEPPKQLAGPVELLKEALRLDREVVSKSCGAAWLRDQARTAEARARYAKERAAEEMRRALAEGRRIMREERERRKQAAKRPVKTTLW